jgi:hypothetical protein
MEGGKMTVYKYNIFFAGDDDKQVRFVVARDEFEADDKMERYRKNLVKRGFADFQFFGPLVEIDNVVN